MAKTIITYGTFDLFHHGHKKILERAKQQGSKLIVGVTGSNYDKARGKLNVEQSLEERIQNVIDSGFADEVIVEEYEGQKIDDIQKYNVDKFVIGDDWIGKFDYLAKYCEVIYLERTKNISSTQIRNEKHSILRIGIVGTGRIANRFVPESKYVSGISVEGVFSHTMDRANKFAKQFELSYFTNDYMQLLEGCDAVYIASSHEYHFEQAKQALQNNKHVLIEKPAVLDPEHLEELIQLAIQNQLVFLEAIKTAFAPAFIKMIELCKIGSIGEVIDITSSFTKLIDDNESRELQSPNGGSVNELASYSLLPIIKLLGAPDHVKFHTLKEHHIDIYTKMELTFNTSFATAITGLKVKREGDLVIAGTKGYIYIPAPWWKTQEFEIRYEDTSKNKHYFYNFEEDGLRYEIAEFSKLIRTNVLESQYLAHQDSLEIIKIVSKFNS